MTAGDAGKLLCLRCERLNRAALTSSARNVKPERQTLNIHVFPKMDNVESVGS